MARRLVVVALVEVLVVVKTLLHLQLLRGPLNLLEFVPVLRKRSWTSGLAIVVLSMSLPMSLQTELLSPSYLPMVPGDQENHRWLLSEWIV
jgi:hypothetical protein